MKVIFHIPTEQFGFIEFEHEVEDIDEAHGMYHSLKWGGTGLSDKEFNAVIDEYLNTGTVIGGMEKYERMDTRQQDVVQVIKRALKRINK